MLLDNKMESLLVNKATYIEGYRISVEFNDGKNKIIDFGPFLATKKEGFLKKYSNTQIFKKVHIEKGNLVWGKEWDLIFPIHQLYKGEIEI